MEEEAEVFEGDEKDETQVESEEQSEELTDEEQKYKNLYEQVLAELEGKRNQSIDTKKETLLKKAGYDSDQVEYFKKFIQGETEDEINSDLSKLKVDFPPKKIYADPNASNGHKQAPKKSNAEDKGRTAYKRLKLKGKIRRR